MLDAYIIDRIRREREREQAERRQEPLRIEPTPPPRPPVAKERPVEREPERGSVIIDFHI